MKGYSLVGEDPEFTEKIEKLRSLGRADGIEFDTADYGGVRSEADTTLILKYRDDDYAVYVRELARLHPEKTPEPMDIWRPIAPWGSGFHHFGDARDLKILKRPASMTEADAQRRLGSHAPECGLRWGGNFKKRVDMPHFENNITLAEAQARWETRTAPVNAYSKPAPNQV